MNHVPHILTPEGELADKQNEMCCMVVEYFKETFVGDHNVIMYENSNEVRVITNVQNDRFTNVITFEEFTKAVKHMHRDKSAGPDWFKPAFSALLELSRNRDL